jgi:hypothetical protein
MSKQYSFSPSGIASFPWVNVPDTKFNADGLYKVDLVLSGDAASSLRSKIDKAIEDAFVELTKDMTPKEAKAHSKAFPYEIEEDDEGRPTGNTIFKFRQNAKITLKSGEKKDIKISLKDATGLNGTTERVTGGSTVKIAYTTRPYRAASSKTISVRLDFAAVQLIKLGSGSSGITFDSVEGGFVDHADAEDQHDNAPTSNDGDY